MLKRTLATCLLLAGCHAKHDVKILSQVCLNPYEGYQFQLCDDLLFEVDKERDVVPKDFVTDLASIPRILWPIWSPNKANTISAAVIHDYMYLMPNGRSRKDVDDIFYQILVNNGLDTTVATKYWLAVRLFGSKYFDPKDKDE